MMKKNISIYLITQRQGIAMIELIFALVIMAISLLSVPMIIQFSTHSTPNLFQQEALSHLSSTLHQQLYTQRPQTTSHPYFSIQQKSTSLLEPPNYKQTKLSLTLPLLPSMGLSPLTQYTMQLIPNDNTAFTSSIRLYGFTVSYPRPTVSLYTVP